MLLGTRRGLRLGLKDECNAALEAKLRINKYGVTIQSHKLHAVKHTVLFRAGEGVTKFLMVLLEDVMEL